MILVSTQCVLVGNKVSSPNTSMQSEVTTGSASDDKLIVRGVNVREGVRPFFVCGCLHDESVRCGENTATDFLKCKTHTNKGRPEHALHQHIKTATREVGRGKGRRERRQEQGEEHGKEKRKDARQGWGWEGRWRWDMGEKDERRERREGAGVKHLQRQFTKLQGNTTL